MIKKCKSIGIDNTDWLQTTTPCSWYGVTCTSDRVTELALQHNNLIGALPSETGNLTALTTLDLYSNDLTALPSEIGDLTALDYLNLGNEWPGCLFNRLTALPPEIGNLTSLTYLNLRWGALNDLPSEISNLTALTVLDLGGNAWGWGDSLPSEIWSLTTLQELYLDENNLTTLPAGIGNLTSLTYLNLSWGSLSNLPPEFGNLTSLQELDLSNNQLSSLPSEFGSLTTLQTLNLSDNQLTSLPSEFGDLTALRNLSLLNNQLSSLPPEFGSLTSLQELNLSFNQLSSLPPELGNLTALQSLDLWDNELITLPTTIGNLNTLSSLDVSDNNLSGTLPSEIGNLTTLVGLSLGNNQLSSLPSSIGNLTELQTLYLGGNDMSVLPSQVGNLTKLWQLDLSGNLLTALPSSMGNLNTLTGLYLHDNPLSGELAAFLTTLTRLSRFTFYDTGWCVPAAGDVPAWLADIYNMYGTGLVCGQAAGSLRGTVTGSGTDPAVGVHINLYRPVWNRWHYVTTTQTIGDGSYQVDGLGQGIEYRVQFVDPTHQYAPEYYDNQFSIGEAASVTVTLGIARTGIDAALSAPLPPLATVKVSGGSVTPNPLDGTVIINMVSSTTNDITVTRVVTCTSGSPTNVFLKITSPGAVYPMIEVGADRYRATIPGSAITRDADLVVVATCGFNATETTVGHVNLYDPSGAVTDAATGQPVVGAIVTLYQVSGWEPKTGPDDGRPNTCQSNLSKDPGSPWSQPAPTHLGTIVNPHVTNVAPPLSYQLTDNVGYYGWDVGEGCWYVKVAATGYEQLNSPVVGVPPEVTDLNLALTPLAGDCIPLTDVGIEGLLDITGSLYIDTQYTFQAIITPTEASEPITYTWMPDPVSEPLTGTATYQWDAPDTHTITLQAENCGGVFTATRQFQIWEAERYDVFLPDHSDSAQPGEVLTFTHTLTNTGDITDTFDLTLSAGWGSLLTSTPITLAQDATSTVQVKITVPTDAISGTVKTTVITATSQLDPDVFATVLNTITVDHVPGVAFATDNLASADPDSIITYTHTLTNTGNGPDAFTLEVASLQDWSVELGGLYPSGTAHLPWRMDIGMTATVIVSVTVPIGSGGLVEVTVITATSQAVNDVYARVINTTTVKPVPGVAFTPDHAVEAQPGDMLTFTHTLTNTGDITDTFGLTLSAGWGALLTTSPITLAQDTVSTVQVKITVPTDAISGTVNKTLITATSQLDSGIFDTVRNVVTVKSGESRIFLPLVIRNH